MNPSPFLNPLKTKMASFLTEEALKRTKDLDSKSPCKKALTRIDVDNVLREDINRICEAVSLNEITRILSLARRLQDTSGEKKEEIKHDLKKIVEAVVARAEKESGRLRIPEPCRQLLLNL